MPAENTLISLYPAGQQSLAARSARGISTNTPNHGRYYGRDASHSAAM
jgi:hypothetical protein